MEWEEKMVMKHLPSIGQAISLSKQLIRTISLLLGSVGILLAQPAFAQEDNQPLGWESSASPAGTYPSAYEACHAQWQHYMDNGYSRFIGAIPYQDDWRFQLTCSPDCYQSEVESGTLTRWLSGSVANACSCGESWTRKVRFSTSWSSKEAALKLLRKLLKKQGFRPEKILTDGLRSYKAAMRELGCLDRHFAGRLQENNRVENSHLPVRRRERKMQRFKSQGQAQRFVSTHSALYNIFPIQRHLTSRKTMRDFR